MFSLKCFDSIHETSEHHCEILDIPAIPANVQWGARNFARQFVRH
jgi:hypothetical protein